MTRSTGRPALALTLGDPAGIGPEILLKSLADPQVVAQADLTVVAPPELLEEAWRRLTHQGHPVPEWSTMTILPVPLEPTWLASVLPGEGTGVTGAISFACLETAVRAALAGQFDGVVTAPIAKSAWWAAGRCYPGQTEYLAEMAGGVPVGMAFVARSPHTGWDLRVLLATVHVPLKDVPRLLTAERLTTQAELLVDWLRHSLDIPCPRLAVAGLNPHSGEQGHLGSEEQVILMPWMEAFQQQHPDVILEGPVPPDTLWVRPAQVWHHPEARPSHDAYLALYHDQGLIPVKVLAFDQAVNTTLGLPFVRTSPDHGTAFDIAGQGMANPASFKAAITWAARLAQRRLAADKPL